jgi:arylsulfatase A-like enzyme
VDDHLVSQIDFAPTIAEWAGTTPATRVNGESLVPLLANPSAPWRTEVLLENRQTGLLRTSFSGVRTAEWLYAEYDNGDRELYDLRADPFQLANVVNVPANAAIVSDLQARLNVLRGS